MRAAAGAALVAVALGACSGGESGLDPRDLSGDWEVTLVVGAVDADADAPQILLPERSVDFREPWRFEACDERGCTLHRPDGGLLLGDLDRVRLELPDDGADELVGEVVAAEPVDEAGAGPCEGAPTDRWTVELRVGAEDRVLSGSVRREPLERRRTAPDGTTCYGIGLSLGFSGVPL